MKRVSALLRGQLRGHVQGVGLRPRLRDRAVALSLAGFVRNERGGLRVEVEGIDSRVDAFFEGLGEEIAVREQRTVEPKGENGFRIHPSEGGPAPHMALPPDFAPCAACMSEVRGAGRRAHYPFTSCTGCGPRWSIATASPWDRERTTMAAFTPCAACKAEYDDVGDRRCHAQTLACPACGPVAWLEVGGERLHDSNAVLRSMDLLVAGKIVAIKGLGGYQLLCDATNDAAVRDLRRRKGREARPFAVLFADEEALFACALPDTDELRAVTSPAAPIVLLRGRQDSTLAPSVAPSSPLVGAMLPASPLHEIVARGVKVPLVCTSGNLAEEPLAIDDADARDRLGAMCDGILGHDRPIARALDDSVVRITRRGPTMLRRARGWAPRTLARHEAGPTVLALGAHMKATVALSLEDEIWVSAHVGDLGTARALDRLAETAREMLSFAGVRPDIVACDLHPDLPGTRLAEELARELGAKVAPIGHHEAHVAAIVAEHGLEGPVLGFAWDGMGHGTDGTIWGGETLLLEGARALRVARLRSFRLVGGDAAAREPRRALLGILREMERPLDAAARWFDEGELEIVTLAHDRRLNAPVTTSMGRLFDAVAALAGLRGVSRFEAEAAMELEQAAHGEAACAGIPMPLVGSDVAVIDWAPLIDALLDERARGATAGKLSMMLVASLADAAASVAAHMGIRDCALGGGCFQNTHLLEAVADALEARGHRVWTARELPPGDGGISVGQAVLAARRY